MNNKIIYLLVVFFAVFVGTGLFLANQSKPETKNNTTTNPDNSATLKQGNIVIPTALPTVGTLSVTGEETSRLGDNITVNLSANSNGKNIVGYDVILYYDRTAFEFVSAQSTLGDFTIYPKNNENYLFLTAIQATSSQKATVLGSGTSETTIANLTFRTKKAGNYNFSLRQSADKEKTNLVTDQTEVMMPALTDLAVEITE